jgi:hypothetical protein
VIKTHFCKYGTNLSDILRLLRDRICIALVSESPDASNDRIKPLIIRQPPINAGGVSKDLGHAPSHCRRKDVPIGDGTVSQYIAVVGMIRGQKQEDSDMIL